MQVHHIIPGDDNIENGIPLCPNCHDEAHTRYSPGRTARAYTPTELKLHRQRTIGQVKREGNMTHEDEQVYTALMSAEPNATERLLDNQLPLIRHNISRSLQEMVIEAINHRWKENPSWAGTVKPRNGLICILIFLLKGNIHIWLIFLKNLLHRQVHSKLSLIVRLLLRKLHQRCYLPKIRSLFTLVLRCRLT